MSSTDQYIEPADTAPGADDIASTLERERLLQAAIERLEEPFRTAMFLRYHEALPPRAIAARLDVSVKTVNSRLARGRAAIREDLDRRFADERDPSGSRWRRTRRCHTHSRSQRASPFAGASCFRAARRRAAPGSGSVRRR